MNILIDTNILIPLEDTSRILDEQYAKLRELTGRYNHRLFIHPAQLDDIAADRDEQRKAILLSRVKQYAIIPSPPNLSDAELQHYGWAQKNNNDRTDNLLLHALCRGAVHFLITNDREIRLKAQRANVQESVHRPEQFLAYLQSQDPTQSRPPYGIKEEYLHTFDVKQSFFDSLRMAYPFDEWYLKSAKAHRKSWCIATGDKVQAICIYKEEESQTIADGLPPLSGKILKLCTFKVGEEMRGRKLGERLLYAAYKYAIEHNIEWVYLTTYGKEQDMLVSLCEAYGFRKFGKYKGQDVLLKSMCPTNKESDSLTPIEYARRYYPNYLDGENVSKFIVPIKPEYHDRLFADTSKQARGLFPDFLTWYAPEGNTIKKAYICHAQTRSISSGDLLLFYRSGDRKSIECIGIAETIKASKDIESVIPMVSKRTVYSILELQDILKRKALVILFWHLRCIRPISMSDLTMAGILSPIQSIRKISDIQYSTIRRLIMPAHL